MKVERRDVDIVLFRRSRGNGGQHNNKTATAVRMTHKATGIRVEACSERSQKANLEAAYSIMAARLQRLAEDSKAEKKREAYQSKPEAAFGAQIRTYNVAEKYVTDHRTGHKEFNVKAVLSGKLDGFIRPLLLSQMTA